MLGLAHRAFHLGVPLVADHDDLAAFGAHLAHFHVDLGHQRTGGVEHGQTATRGVRAHFLRHAVRAEDDR